MDEKLLAALVAARGHAKGSITKLLKYTAEGELSNRPLTELIIRKDRLIKVFDDFEKAQRQIDALQPDGQLDKVEDEYYTILQRLEEAIAARQVPVAPVPPASTSISPSGPSVRFNLPPIQVPIFDGKYTEYTTFMSLFNSIIGNDQHLDLVHKLYHLRTRLEGEPLRLIENLPLTSESYTASKEILDGRYNNRFQIIAEHINRLLDTNSMIRSTAGNIREFVSNVKQQTAALKNLNLPVDSWDAILVIILCKKLDSITNRSFQMERNPKQEPKLSELIDFLEKRALALELADPATTGPKPQLERPAPFRPAWKASAVAAAPGGPVASAPAVMSAQPTANKEPEQASRPADKTCPYYTTANPA